MCSSRPKAPVIETPPPPQPMQAPVNIDTKRRNAVNNTGAFASLPGSTLLTSPSGAGAPTIGKSTLLGN
jgi:hypothetical protein